MKFYVLDGTVNGHTIKGKKFSSRRRAEQAMESILFRDNLQVQDDRFPSKHTEEFVCDHYTRFFIRRVVIA